CFAGLRVLLAKLVMPHDPTAYCRHIGSALLSAKSSQRLAACYPRANGFGNLIVIICWPSHYGVSSTPSLYTSVTRRACRYHSPLAGASPKRPPRNSLTTRPAIFAGIMLDALPSSWLTVENHMGGIMPQRSL